MRFLAIHPQIAMFLLLIPTFHRARFFDESGAVPGRSPTPAEPDERSLHDAAHRQAVQHLRDLHVRYHLNRRPF